MPPLEGPGRPHVHTEVSADGNYVVRVPVDGYGDAEEATNRARRRAQRLLNEQYQPPLPQLNTYVTVTADGYGHVNYSPLREVPRAPHELTAREYAAYQAAIVDNFGTGMWSIAPPAVPLPPPTPEQLREAERQAAASREREVERQQRAAAHQLRIAAAHEKGLLTLRRMLSPEQLREYDISKSFKVKGSEGNLYKIDTTYGYSGNIYWIDKRGTKLAEFCCHPDMYGHDLQGDSDRMPPSDAYIAQKLVLEADELSFLRTTVLNSGNFPPVVRENHTATMTGHLRCRCTKCRPNPW